MQLRLSVEQSSCGPGRDLTVDAMHSLCVFEKVICDGHRPLLVKTPISLYRASGFEPVPAAPRCQTPVGFIFHTISNDVSHINPRLVGV